MDLIDLTEEEGDSHSDSDTNEDLPPISLSDTARLVAPLATHVRTLVTVVELFYSACNALINLYGGTCVVDFLLIDSPRGGQPP